MSDFSDKRVLFAEDNLLSQEILFEMLADLGCEVDVASDGRDAVECAQARSYDLILMDLQMPRMDGLTAARAIRAMRSHRDTPIVALTANAFAEDRQRCFDAGMNGHLGKPITPATLAAALGQWLPGLVVSAEEMPACDSALRHALTEIPGFEIRPAMCRSAKQLAAYCALLNRFVKGQGQEIAQLREHLAAGDKEAAHVIAHNLKGIAGLVGATRIAGLASDIELGLREGVTQDTLIGLADACNAAVTSLAAAFTRLPYGG